MTSNITGTSVPLDFLLSEHDLNPEYQNGSAPTFMAATVTAEQEDKQLESGLNPSGYQVNNNHETTPTVSSTDREQQYEHPKWTFQPYSVEMRNNPVMEMNEMRIKQSLQSQEKNESRRRRRGQ